MIKPEFLLRLAGIAAMVGGALRIAAAAPLPLSGVQLEALYDTIDVLLLFAIIGIYLPRASPLGITGLLAFGLAIAALSFIGGPDADPFGFSTYQEGATVLALALAALSLVWIVRGQKPIVAPLFWFLSIISGGVLQMFPQPIGDYGMVTAGVLFGLGFVAAGYDLVRTQQ